MNSINIWRKTRCQAHWLLKPSLPSYDSQQKIKPISNMFCCLSIDINLGL